MRLIDLDSPLWSRSDAKLAALWVCPKASGWVPIVLAYRPFKVQVDNMISEEAVILSWAIQGSVTGFLFYFVMMNELPDDLERSAGFWPLRQYWNVMGHKLKEFTSDVNFLQHFPSPTSASSLCMGGWQTWNYFRVLVREIWLKIMSPRKSAIAVLVLTLTHGLTSVLQRPDHPKGCDFVCALCAVSS